MSPIQLSPIWSVTDLTCIRISMATYHAHDTAMRYYRLRGGRYKPTTHRPQCRTGHKLHTNCYSLPACRRFVVSSAFFKRFRRPMRAFHACMWWLSFGKLYLSCVIVFTTWWTRGYYVISCLFDTISSRVLVKSHVWVVLVQCCTLYGNAGIIANTRYRTALA